MCHTAIGDWSDGTENSVMQELYGDIPAGTLQYLAAKQGKAFRQKAVLSFKIDRDGKHSVYSMDTNETNMDSIRETLSKNNLPFRTLVPTKKGTRIVIYDDGYDIYKDVKAVGDHYKASVNVTKGTGNFVGHPTSRLAAMHEYDTIIKEHEGSARIGQVFARGVLKGGMQ